MYGPINPRYFGPWPPNPTLAVPYVSHALVQRVGKVTLLQGAPPCVPCDRAGAIVCRQTLALSLRSSQPARVVAEVDRILAAGAAAR